MKYEIHSYKAIIKRKERNKQNKKAKNFVTKKKKTTKTEKKENIIKTTEKTRVNNSEIHSHTL